MEQTFGEVIPGGVEVSACAQGLIIIFARVSRPPELLVNPTPPEQSEGVPRLQLEQRLGGQQGFFKPEASQVAVDQRFPDQRRLRTRRPPPLEKLSRLAGQLAMRPPRQRSFESDVRRSR